MSNNKYEATFFDPKPSGETQDIDPVRKPRKPRSRRVQAARRLPLPAQIGAGVFMAVVVIGGFAGCVAANDAGTRYQECADQLSSEVGHDAAVYELENGACR